MKAKEIRDITPNPEGYGEGRGRRRQGDGARERARAREEGLLHCTDKSNLSPVAL